MIRSFADQATEDIFHGVKSKHARQALPQSLWKIAVRKLDQIHAAASLLDLRSPPANDLKKLKGKESYAIRINDQYRVRFRFEDGKAFHVQVGDFH